MYIHVYTHTYTYTSFGQETTQDALRIILFRPQESTFFFSSFLVKRFCQRHIWKAKGGVIMNEKDRKIKKYK